MKHNGVMECVCIDELFNLLKISVHVSSTTSVLCNNYFRFRSVPFRSAPGFTLSHNRHHHQGRSRALGLDHASTSGNETCTCVGVVCRHMSVVVKRNPAPGCCSNEANWTVGLQLALRHLPSQSSCLTSSCSDIQCSILAKVKFKM